MKTNWVSLKLYSKQNKISRPIIHILLLSCRLLTDIQTLALKKSGNLLLGSWGLYWWFKNASQAGLWHLYLLGFLIFHFLICSVIPRVKLLSGLMPIVWHYFLLKYLDLFWHLVCHWICNKRSFNIHSCPSGPRISQRNFGSFKGLRHVIGHRYCLS